MTTRTVVPIHTTLAAKARGVAHAAYLAAEHIGCSGAAACRISARAVERYRNGECSPAMAVARATAEARNDAQISTLRFLFWPKSRWHGCYVPRPGERLAQSCARKSSPSCQKTAHASRADRIPASGDRLLSPRPSRSTARSPRPPVRMQAGFSIALHNFCTANANRTQVVDANTDIEIDCQLRAEQRANQPPKGKHP